MSSIYSFLFSMLSQLMLKLLLTTDILKFVRSEVLIIQSMSDHTSGKPLKGWEKHKVVFNAIKSRYPTIKSYVINLAIEMTVAQHKRF